MPVSSPSELSGRSLAAARPTSVRKLASERAQVVRNVAVGISGSPSRHQVAGREIGGPAEGARRSQGAHCRDARHRFRKPEVDRRRKNDGRRMLVSLARLSRVDSAERAEAYVAVVWPAASTAFPVAPSSALLPALERVGHRVRRLPGIERLQRIDDVVVIDDIPCCGSPQRGVGLDRTCVGRPRRKHRPLFRHRHLGIPHNVQRVAEGEG